MASGYVDIPFGGVAGYSSTLAFPALASDGELAIDLSTDSLYVYKMSTNTWILIASPGGGGGAITALTGDVGATGPGAVTATIQANAVTNAKLAKMPANTIKGNNTGSLSNAVDLTVSQVETMLSLSGTNSGDVTIGISNGLSLTGQVLSLTTSSTSTTGALTSTDWNTFNNKQSAGNYITALTGDGGASGPGSSVFTLSTVNANTGSFGTASSVATVTVNAKGLVLSASSVAIQIAESQVTNLVSDLAGKQPTGNYITALTGDVSATGPGSVSSTVNSVGGKSAASIASTVTTVSAATSSNTPSTLVLRDSSGNFSAGTITATLAGNASNITTTSNSTIVTLSSLVLPGSQVSGNISGNAANVTGTVAIANGGTNATTVSDARTNLGITAGSSFITSGTTYTTPSNITASTQFKFTLIGGGGGGGGMNTTNGKASGGGAAGVGIVFLTGLAASTAYTIAIGAGGAGGISTTTAPNPGSNTILTVAATTYGAFGAKSGSSAISSPGGSGGGTYNVTIGLIGQAGGASTTAAATSRSGQGGSNQWGEGGQFQYIAGNGLSGTGFGSGGAGGSGLAANGGAGAPGAILVEWYN